MDRNKALFGGLAALIILAIVVSGYNSAQIQSLSQGGAPGQASADTRRLEDLSKQVSDLSKQIGDLAKKVAELPVGGSQPRSEPKAEPTTRRLALTLMMLEIGHGSKKMEYHRWMPGLLIVNKGDTVVIDATNADDHARHGIQMAEYKVNEFIDSEKTATIKFTADKPGVFTFYCNIPACAPDHALMIGQLIVLG